MIRTVSKIILKIVNINMIDEVFSVSSNDGYPEPKCIKIILKRWTNTKGYWVLKPYVKVFLNDDRDL